MIFINISLVVRTKVWLILILSDENPLDEKWFNENPLDENPLDENPLDQKPLDQKPLDETGQLKWFTKIYKSYYIQ